MSTQESPSIQRLSVIVPKNPFAPSELQDHRHCLCALDILDLMKWWPGKPHFPHHDAGKVMAIQRSLDWKRVAHIAAYLLQEELHDVSDKMKIYFNEIYGQKENEPGREWPPKMGKVIGFSRSEFPIFSNVLIHVNGAKIEDINILHEHGAGNLIFDENDNKLNFSVIDGQHRINGAYLAVMLLREKAPDVTWKIPAEVFLDLDATDAPPRKQAQIFIDVNFYQKKVDRSLVSDLFPTARGERDSLDRKERAQDIGRKLMLETGPLVGMIRIPGIRYGAKDVITLSTLNGAIEDVIEEMEKHDIPSFGMQTEFLAQLLIAWLEASGRFENKSHTRKIEISSQNVAYQGRILTSVITLIPAVIWKLKETGVQFISDEAQSVLIDWLKEIAQCAGLLEGGVFIAKDKFKELGYLGSGGIGRFRDLLWAGVKGEHGIPKEDIKTIQKLAEKNRVQVQSELVK